MDILGISCFYHDSSACLVRDGKVIAAAQEERFSRQKNTDAFPIHSLNYCAQQAGILFEDIAHIGYFEKPYLKLSRVLIEHLNMFPFSLKSFMRQMPKWMDDRLILPLLIKEELSTDTPVHFFKHHLSHAASAFLPSPFEEAAIFTCDGVGEWATMSKGRGTGSKIELSHEITYPHSLGLLYTTFTIFLGFHAQGGEGKTMGMAGYGQPRYMKEIRELVHVYEDGSFRLNLKYFAFRAGSKMWNVRFEKLFGRPRQYHEPIEQSHYDMAASLQAIVEEIFLKTARQLHKETGLKKLCLAGGVTLNCVANAKILEQTPFDDVFVQAAAGDAGGSLGSALYLSNVLHGHPRHEMKDAYLGPAYSEHEILRAIKASGFTGSVKLTADEMAQKAAQHIFEKKTLGWFQGRMEFGPRALGGRSILASPCHAEIKDIINDKIKKREAFRPYAPMVLKERASEFFNLTTSSPYMLLAPTIKAEKKALLPGITHADDSARVQTVGEDENPILRKLIVEFEKLSGVPVLLNTSFNRNGEPVVCTPENALDCFMKTKMDALAIGPYWLART